MTWEAWATVAVIGLVLYVLVSNKASPDVTLRLAFVSTWRAVKMTPASAVPC